MFGRSARVASFLLLAIPVFGAEIELRYAAIERLLADQLFTQEGRLYVRGNPKTKCTYAYIEAPRVGADHGYLRITGRFSGRTAFDMFGRCVGLGDAFDFTMLGTPVVRDGALAFQDVQISTPRDSYYVRRVRDAMTRSMSRDFQIPVKDQARALIELSAKPGAGKDPAKSPAGDPFKRELASFELGGVRVTPDGLVLVIEFRLIVK